MTMPTNLQGSTPQGGGVSLRSFGVGRAVIIFPIAEEMGTAFGTNDPKPYIRCNVVALPDPKSPPFITFGGEVLQDGVTVKVPDTHRVDLGPHGWLAENVKIGGGGMLYILRKALGGIAGPSARVGRLWKDQNYNLAWKLTEPDKDEPALMEQAAWWISLYNSGGFTNVYPVPVAQVPAQPQYAPQPPQQGWPANPAPQSAPPAQQGWQQPAPAQPQPAYAGPPAQQGWQQPQGDPNAYAQQPPQQGWAQQAPQGPQPGWGAPQQVAPQQPQQPQQGWGQQQPAPQGPPQGDPNVPHPGF